MLTLSHQFVIGFEFVFHVFYNFFEIDEFDISENFFNTLLVFENSFCERMSQHLFEIAVVILQISFPELLRFLCVFIGDFDEFGDESGNLFGKLDQVLLFPGDLFAYFCESVFEGLLLLC